MFRVLSDYANCWHKTYIVLICAVSNVILVYLTATPDSGLCGWKLEVELEAWSAAGNAIVVFKLS